MMIYRIDEGLFDCLSFCKRGKISQDIQKDVSVVKYIEDHSLSDDGSASNGSSFVK